VAKKNIKRLKQVLVVYLTCDDAKPQKKNLPSGPPLTRRRSSNADLEGVSVSGKEHVHMANLRYPETDMILCGKIGHV
jgi:hypothetical protein